MWGNLFWKKGFPAPLPKNFLTKEKVKISKHVGATVGRPFLYFCMYSLTTKCKYCIIKGRKRALREYGIFLSAVFICIFAGGVAHLLYHAAKREEFGIVFGQSPFLCMGRADIRAFNASFVNLGIFAWHFHWQKPQWEPTSRKGAHRTFGVCQSLVFVLF